MNSQTLAISGTDLKTNQPFQMVLKSSNPFMLSIKYKNLSDDLFIEAWTIMNNEWEAGNTGMNAGAYLFETMEELTGMDLSRY